MTGAATPGAPARPLVTVEIDGHKLQVEAGRNMLDVALSHGFDLPFFCWHPAMGSIGACRQCAVKLFWTDREGKDRSEIAMACMTEAQEGTRISVDDDEAIRFRAAMIELMMTSHPHDCPVCDEGGECHLQDMTVMTGHAYRRFEGRKRTFENQDLGPFVNHELDRCITCYRCSRFYNDYAGGDDFGVFGLRNQVYFGRHQDGPLESEFSGNLIEVCPTGVFTDKTFKPRYARKWDLQTAPSICPHCGLGCNVQPAERAGVLRRVLSRFNPEINRMFLCDRGRFGYEFVNAADRIRMPVHTEIVRRPPGTVEDGVSGKLAAPAVQPVAPGQALGLAVTWLRQGRTIGIGSPRASLEDNFAVRTLVGADDFFLGMSDDDFDLTGLVVDILSDERTSAAALADIQRADAVVVLGEDVTDVAPMLDLTIRTWLHLRPTEAEERNHIRRWNDAAITRFKRREPSALWLATPYATKLDEVAEEAWRAEPGDLVDLALAVAHAVGGGPPEDDPAPGMTDDGHGRVARWAAALKAARSPVVVCGTSSGSSELLRAAAELAWTLPDAKIVLTVPEPDSVGLRLMGGQPLGAAFAALARGQVETVVTLENDLSRRAPALLVDDALAHARRIVSLDYLLNDTSARADLVLPTAPYAEATGTYVNNEGRAQRFFRVFPAAEETQEAWKWVRDLLSWLGRTDARDWETLDGVLGALERELPQLEGVAAAAPAASWRAHGRKVARQANRRSGRTALDAPAEMHEPAPDDDPDSALAFSLEGLAADSVPAALMPRTWTPGWDSASGLHKLQEEVEGPLRGGPTGARLISATAPRDAWTAAVATGRTTRPGEWLLVPVHHIFGSDDLSMHAAGIARRAPTPYLALNDHDAALLEVREGDWLTAWFPWFDLKAPFRRLPSLPDGVAGVPAGLPGAPFVALPVSTRVQRLDPLLAAGAGARRETTGGGA